MSNTINGRTPEEIKRGLEFCNMHQCPLLKCPYFNEAYCGETLNADALAYIQQLESDKKRAIENAKILSDAVKRLETERDAAVKDMKTATLCGCHVCKHYYRPNPEARKYACRIHGSFEEHDFITDDGSIFCGAFEWRGVQEVE